MLRDAQTKDLCWRSESCALPVAGACSCWMPTLIPLSHSRFRSYTMVQRWQVERMALYFLSSSHKQTGEKLHLLSPSFPRGSVSNYHCTDRSEKTLDEVFEGSWSKVFTHFPLLPALSVLSSHGTWVGFSLVVPGASPTFQSFSFGSVAFLLYSLSLGYRDWKSQPIFTFPFQQHCGVGKAFPVPEVPGDVPEVAESGCAWPRSADRALPGLGGFPGPMGILYCREALQGEQARPGT